MDFDPVGMVMAWIGIWGLVGLFTVSFTERFIPILPSHGLLLAVGMAAAEGEWSLFAAWGATLLGGILGTAGAFHAVRALGEARSMRFVRRTGRLCGMNAKRLNFWITAFRKNQTSLAFALQLVPALRYLSPALAALIGLKSRKFLAASFLGMVVWNGLFLGIGYTTSQAIPTANTTVLALTVLAGLLIAEILIFRIARRLRARRPSQPEAELLETH